MDGLCPAQARHVPSGKREWEKIFDRNPAPYTLDKLDSAAKGWSLFRPAISEIITATVKRKEDSCGAETTQSVKRHHRSGSTNVTGTTQAHRARSSQQRRGALSLK